MDAAGMLPQRRAPRALAAVLVGTVRMQAALLLPRPHALARAIEQALVVALADLLAGAAIQQLPQRLIQLVDVEVLSAVSRAELVGAEQKPLRVAVDDRRRALGRRRRRLQVL